MKAKIRNLVSQYMTATRHWTAAIEDGDEYGAVYWVLQRKELRARLAAIRGAR